MLPKRARTSMQPSSRSISYSKSRFISSTAQDVIGSQFFYPILVKRELILFYFSPDLATIFTTWGLEPLLVELNPSPSLLVQEFYANIHDISRSTFRVFLRGKTIKIILDVMSSTVYIPRVVHPLFPYLSIDTLSDYALCAQICGLSCTPHPCPWTRLDFCMHCFMAIPLTFALSSTIRFYI